MGRIKKLVFMAAIVAVAMLPALITWWMPVFFFDATIWDYVPSALYVFNDASFYWQGIDAFAHAGFNSGYSGREEDLARLPFIHFGWQNFIVYFYGAFASILGWQLWSSVIWNPIMLGSALLCFMAVIRCTWSQLILAGLFVSTFWPMLFFLPTMMAEPFHYAIAVLAAAGFACMLDFQEKKRTWAGWLTAALLFTATVARPSWAPLLLLSVLFTVNRITGKHIMLGIFKGIILCIAAYGMFYLMMPNTSTYSPSGVIISGGLSLSLIFKNLLDNIYFLSLGGPLRILFRGQVALVLCMAIAMLAYWLVKNKDNLKERLLSDSDWFVHSFNILSILILTMFAYTTNNWGDYRIVSVHMLFSGLLAIARRKSVAIPIVIIASNMIMTPFFAQAYQQFKGLEFAYDRENLARFEEEIKPYLRFQPQAEPWENTVLYGGTYPFFPTELIALPSGMGMRFIFNPANLRFPIHSRYVLFDKFFHSWFPDKDNLRFIAKTHIGDLFQNTHGLGPDSTRKDNRHVMIHGAQTEHLINEINQRRSESFYNYSHMINSMAVKHNSKGSYKKSLALFTFSAYIHPEQPDVYYNIACVYAKQHMVKKSVRYLKTALDKGFHNWELIMTDPDLDSIRGTQDYVDIIAGQSSGQKIQEK